MARILTEHRGRQWSRGRGDPERSVLGLVLATQEALEYFQDGSAVVNIAFTGGVNPFPGGTVYGSRKAAVDLITKTHAKELAPRIIRVNALDPGPTVTEGTDAMGINDADNRLEAMFVASTPLGRLGQPEDIAKVAGFLASDDAGWLTGELVYASGDYR